MVDEEPHRGAADDLREQHLDIGLGGARAGFDVGLDRAHRGISWRLSDVNKKSGRAPTFGTDCRAGPARKLCAELSTAAVLRRRTAARSPAHRRVSCGADGRRSAQHRRRLHRLVGGRHAPCRVRRMGPHGRRRRLAAARQRSSGSGHPRLSVSAISSMRTVVRRPVVTRLRTALTSSGSVILAGTLRASSSSRVQGRGAQSGGSLSLKAGSSMPRRYGAIAAPSTACSGACALSARRPRVRGRGRRGSRRARGAGRRPGRAGGGPRRGGRAAGASGRGRTARSRSVGAFSTTAANSSAASS